MTITVHVVNAFPKGRQGGNPAGIVLDPQRALQPTVRQRIAATVRLSETVFISDPENSAAHYRLEFFTPTRQIPHCGHATIAAFNFLARACNETRVALIKETIDQPRQILMHGEQVFMEQVAPQYEQPRVAPEHVAKALGLQARDFAAHRLPEVVSTGNRFLLVPLATDGALRMIVPDVQLIGALSDQLDLIGLYPFVIADHGVSDAVAYARMFAPRYGIDEESATGMAAGPLACYLHDRCGVPGTSLVIGQGEHMPVPSPSRITVNLELEVSGCIARLMVGGGGHLVETRQVVLDNMQEGA